MAVKRDLGTTWQCGCRKWNFADAKTCWKCHQPKYPTSSKPKKTSNILQQSKEADALRKAVVSGDTKPELLVHDTLVVEKPKKRGRPKKEVKMGKASIIRVDGSELELDHRPSLKEAQDIIRGFVELVKVGGGRTLVVNEFGKIRNLPLNKAITSAYGNKIYGGYIVGDVIVLEGWRTVGI